MSVRFLEDHGMTVDDAVPIAVSELESVLQRLTELLHASLRASSDVSGVAYYLKLTVQKSLRYHKHVTRQSRISAQYVQFVIHGLDTILHRTSLVRTYPTILAVLLPSKKVNLYSPRVRKYVNGHSIRTLKVVSSGLDTAPCEGYVLSLQSTVNALRNSELARAFFRVTSSTFPIGILLVMQDLYFPLVLKSGRRDSLIDDHWAFALILFTVHRSITEPPERFVEFFYTTDRESLGIEGQSIAALGLDKSTDGYLDKHPEDLLTHSTRIDGNGIMVKRVRWNDLVEYSRPRLRTFKRRLKNEKRKATHSLS